MMQNPTPMKRMPKGMPPKGMPQKGKGGRDEKRDDTVRMQVNALNTRMKRRRKERGGEVTTMPVGKVGRY